MCDFQRPLQPTYLLNEPAHCAALVPCICSRLSPTSIICHCSRSRLHICWLFIALSTLPWWNCVTKLYFYPSKDRWWGSPPVPCLDPAPCFALTSPLQAARPDWHEHKHSYMRMELVWDLNAAWFCCGRVSHVLLTCLILDACTHTCTHRCKHFQLPHRRQEKWHDERPESNTLSNNFLTLHLETKAFRMWWRLTDKNSLHEGSCDAFCPEMTFHHKVGTGGSKMEVTALTLKLLAVITVSHGELWV